MWGIFRQLYDVGILNFQPTHDLLWLYLAYIFPISSLYLPYIFNIPSIYLECSFLLSTFFLISSYPLPTHYFVFTKGIFSVVIVRYESLMSQELLIFNFQLSTFKFQLSIVCEFGIEQMTVENSLGKRLLVALKVKDSLLES